MGFWIALQFLTIIPLPFKKDYDSKDIGTSLIYFPIIGLLIGLFLFLVNWGLGEIFSGAVTAALTLAIWVWISGALHLDGLIDSFDGLAGNTPGRRLEIMADSHVGVYGIVGAFILLLVKFAAIVSISGNWGWETFLLAPVIGSWAMVLAIFAFPYARKSGGLGQVFKQGASKIRLFIATLITLAAVIFVAGWQGLAMMAIICFTILAAGVFFSLRLGGLTGDTYGAIKEITEAIVLVITPVLLIFTV
ncbi:MAG: adenosylcobinamide-GDP ribazoletransferase [Dehalococcoidales bacterium]|nr:adenosylcobinamide-GDP ribazoletransferase [Dehalococcoidales bacterium]